MVRVASDVKTCEDESEVYAIDQSKLIIDEEKRQEQMGTRVKILVSVIQRLTFVTSFTFLTIFYVEQSKIMSDEWMR